MIKIIWSRRNEIICKSLLESALETAKDKKVNVDILSVPGAFEIPFALQCALKSNQVQGVVVLGCLIRGETPHFEALMGPIFSQIQNLSLEYSKPVGTGILTVENLNQAFDRAGGKLGNKGREAVDVVSELILKFGNLKKFENLNKDLIQ